MMFHKIIFSIHRLVSTGIMVYALNAYGQIISKRKYRVADN